VNRVVRVLGPPGTGRSHLATALGVEAVKAGRSVYFATLADIAGMLACLSQVVTTFGAGDELKQVADAV
jgi:DNA replication protein DnaC